VTLTFDVQNIAASIGLIEFAQAIHEIS